MPYTFGYGQQKTTTTEDIRNIPGRLNRGFTQESTSFITPSIKKEPTFTQKVLGTVPKPVLKAFSSDSILLRNPLTAPVVIPAQKLFPNTFGKESERLRKRFVDSASFGLTGEIDKYLGKDVSYREGKSFANDKLGATLDLTATLGGYLIPGLGWAKAAKAIGVGAKAIPKLAQGATKLQQVNRLGKIAAQQAKEGVAVGAAISGSEIGVREAINPDDYSASDNLRKLGVDTLSGLVLDPAFYAGGKLIGKGYSKLFKKIENQPEVKQNVQNVVNLKNIPQVQQDIKIAAMSTDGKNYVLNKINPNFELPKKVYNLPTKPTNIGYRNGTFKPQEISDSLLDQTGSRDTGHFGTGHYFFGSEEKAKAFRKERPVTKIDLKNLNLFRPKDEEIGYQLHEVLKEANNNAFVPPKPNEMKGSIKKNITKDINEKFKDLDLQSIKLKEDTISFIKDFLDTDFQKKAKEYDNSLRYFESDKNYFFDNLEKYLINDYVSSNNIDVPKNKYRKEFEKAQSDLTTVDLDTFRVYTDNKTLNELEITKLYKDEQEKVDELYSKLIPDQKISSIARNYFYDYIQPMLVSLTTKGNTDNFIKTFKDVLEKNGRKLTDKEISNIKNILKTDISEISSKKPVEELKFEDSISTRIMKYLGYDGVDVRGFKALDNEAYGSVVYSNAKNLQLPKSKTKKSKKSPEIINAEIKTEENMKKNVRYSEDYEIVPVDDAIRLIEFDRRFEKTTSEEFGRKNIDRLKTEILKDGLLEPIIIKYNPETGLSKISEGNHRIQALKELGFDKVPVMAELDKTIERTPTRMGVDLPLRILPNEFGDYKVNIKPSDILQRNNKILIPYYNPKTKKTSLRELTSKDILSEFQIEQLNKIKMQQPKKLLIIRDKVQQPNAKVKEANDNIDFINKIMEQKKPIGNTVKRFPTTVGDVVNPELKKGRYGQARYLVPEKENDYLSMDLLDKEEIVRLSEIVNIFKQAFGVPISTKNGKKALKQAYGVYLYSGRIKMRSYDNVQTVGHEVAHYISIGKYALFNKYQNALPNFQKGIRDEAVEYLRRAGWDKESEKHLFEEGFAEFVRRYLFYPEAAKKEAPNFYQLLMDTLNKKEKEIIINLQEKIKKFSEQNVMQRAYSEISFGEKKKVKLPSFYNVKQKYTDLFTKVYTKFVEELQPIKKLLEPYGSEGMQVFNDARLLRGVGGKAKQWIEFGVTDDSGNVIGDSLTKILKPISEHEDEFVIYLINKRALDLIGRKIDVGNKMLDRDRVKIVKHLEKKYPHFKTVQEDLLKFQIRVVLELHYGGLISLSEVKKMFGLNPNYVPYYRDYDLDEQTILTSMKKKTGTATPIFNIKGSTMEIINPIESIVKNVYSFIYIAEKNKMLRRIVDLAFSSKDPTVLSKIGKHIEEIQVPSKQTKLSLKEIRKNIEAQFNLEAWEVMNKANDRIDYFQSKLDEGKITQEFFDKKINEIITERNEKLKSIKFVANEFNYEKMANIFRPNPQVVKNMPNVITVYYASPTGTKQRYFQLSPDLYNSIMLNNTFNQGFVFNIFNFPTRLVRAGVTNTMEFLFNTMFRDQFQLAVSSKTGYVPYVDMIKGVFHVLGKSQDFQKFLTFGAEQSFRSSLDRNYLKENVRKIIKEKSNIPGMNIIKNPIKILELLENIGRIGEQGAKVQIFRKYVKQNMKPGVDPVKIYKEAGLEARDAMDFSRKGSFGKNINAVSAFYNASIQGFDKTVRTFTNKSTAYKAFLRANLYITLPTIALYLMNREDPRYQELQEWDKDLFWHFWVGDKHYRLPIPFELGVIFKTFPERILRTLDEENKPWSGFGKTVLNSIPFVPTPYNITLLAPMSQVMSNRNFFGSKIVPTREEFLPPEERYGYSTSESAKLISNLIAKIPGYRNYRTTEILATPRYIDTLVQGYFGPLGKYATDVMDAVMRPFNGKAKPEKELGSLPLLKAFIAREITNTKSFDEFYNELKRLREEYNASLKNNELFLELEKKNRYETAAKTLQAFTRQQRSIEESKTLTSEQKRKMIQESYRNQINYVRMFLGKSLIPQYQYVTNKNN